MGSASSSTSDQLCDLDQDLITLCRNFFISEDGESNHEYLLSSYHVPGTMLTTSHELFHSTVLFLAVTIHQMHFIHCLTEFSQQLCEEAILMIPILQKRRLRVTQAMFLEQGSPTVSGRAKI